MTDGPYKNAFPREKILEFVQDENGRLVLREVANKDEVLLCIEFSETVKNLFGDDIQYIGEHMMHAAMAAAMRKHLDRWNAYVYDEEPKHYS